MKNNYPHYKLEISYFGIKGSEKIDETKETIFENEHPIIARTNAVERYSSYLDIFKDAKIEGQIHNWKAVFKNNYDEHTIPTLNLYIRYNDDELVLFGSLLENFEERMKELECELNYYNEHKIEHNGTEIIKDFDNKFYIILKNSLIHKEDKSKIKSIGGL